MGEFLRALSLAFFDFSLKLAGSFLLAEVAVHVLFASGGMFCEMLRLPLPEVVDFARVGLPQKRCVIVALLLLAPGKFLLFAPAFRLALCGAGGREEAPDGVHHAVDSPGRLFLPLPELLGIPPVVGIAPVEVFAEVAVEIATEPGPFLGLRFDDPLPLLGLAFGDGFSESLGLDLNGS